MEGARATKKNQEGQGKGRLEHSEPPGHHRRRTEKGQRRRREREEPREREYLNPFDRHEHRVTGGHHISPTNLTRRTSDANSIYVLEWHLVTTVFLFVSITLLVLTSYPNIERRPLHYD